MSDRLPALGASAGYVRHAIGSARIEHRRYINERGEDHPIVLGWRCAEKAGGRSKSSTEGDNV